MEEPLQIQTFIAQDSNGAIALCLITAASSDFAEYGIAYVNTQTRELLLSHDAVVESDWEKTVVVLQSLGAERQNLGPIKREVLKLDEGLKQIVRSFIGQYNSETFTITRIQDSGLSFMFVASILTGLLNNYKQKGVELDEAAKLLREELPPRFLPNFEGIFIIVKYLMESPNLNIGRVCEQCPLAKIHLTVALNELLNPLAFKPGPNTPSLSN